MSILKCKGMILKQEIATVFTPLAQVIDLELPKMKSETFEADTLDNASAGIPKMPTGRTDPGSLSGNLFFDPALTGHKALLDLLKTPALCNWKLVFPNSPATEWAFSGAGLELGASANIKEGLKASFSIELNGLPTFPS